MQAMQPWSGAFWGAVGGAVVEFYDTVAVMRVIHQWPWLVEIPDDTTAASAKDKWNAFGRWLFAASLRILAGAGGAAAASGQLTGPLPAFGMGVAGPLALERLMAQVKQSDLDASPSFPKHAGPQRSLPDSLVEEASGAG